MHAMSDGNVALEKAMQVTRSCNSPCTFPGYASCLRTYFKFLPQTMLSQDIYPSVSLSVTRWYCVETAKCIIFFTVAALS